MFKVFSVCNEPQLEHWQAEEEENNEEDSDPELEPPEAIDAAPLFEPPQLHRATPLESVEGDGVGYEDGLQAVKLEVGEGNAGALASKTCPMLLDPAQADTLVMASPHSAKITTALSQDSNPQFGMTPTSPPSQAAPMAPTAAHEDELASLDAEIARLQPLV